MKNTVQIILVIVLSATTSQSYSQSSERIIPKYSIELTPTASTSKWNVSPTFSFRGLEKHQFDIGFGITGGYSFAKSVIDGLELSTGYRFYPNGNNNKVNHYFLYLIKNYFATAEVTFGFNHMYWNQFEQDLAYGMEVGIGKKWFFHYDLGLGIVKPWTNSNDPNVQAMAFDASRIYMAGNIRVGFGYKFGRKITTKPSLSPEETRRSIRKKRERPKFNFGLEVNTNISASSANWGPTFSFRGLEKHQFDIGIGTTILDVEDISYQPFEGIETTLAYKFLPFGKTNRSKFYIQFLFKYYNELSSQSGKFQNNRHFEQLLGIGFETPIGNRLYFRNDLGTGFIEQTPYNYWVSNQIYKRVHANLYFRIGFGFKFGKKD